MNGDVRLAVIGGGPAGMAAASEGARAGLDTVLFDEASGPGGQIYRGPPAGFSLPQGRDAVHERGDRLRAELTSSGCRVRSDTGVLGLWPGGRVLWARGNDTGMMRADAVVVAAGARERPIPFPGWTLPGVMTAGAAQAFVRTFGVRPGRVALVAGTGPLLFPVARQLHDAGMKVAAVLDAARPPLSPRTWFGLWRRRDLLREALGHWRTLRRAGVPLYFHHAVFEVQGKDAAERAVLGPVDPLDGYPRRDRARAIEVDLVVASFGFEPNTELVELAGCGLEFDGRRGGWVPVRDAHLRTTVPEVFAVGDGAGIGGALAAEEEGRIAGIHAAEQLGALTSKEAEARCAGPRERLTGLMPVRALVGEMTWPKAGLYGLATDDTPVCRCEEVTLREIRAAVAAGAGDLGAVKMRTRLGMGACQGRFCAAAAATLVGRLRDTAPEVLGRIHARPPVRPVTLGALARMEGAR